MPTPQCMPSVLSAEPEAAAPFKICSMCHTEWSDFRSFISDPSLRVEGYQAFFDNPDDGLILFTHRARGCNSTIAMKAATFKFLYQGPDHSELLRGTPSCAGHCLHSTDLEACNACCNMRWVRDVLQLLRQKRIQ